MPTITTPETTKTNEKRDRTKGANKFVLELLARIGDEQIETPKNLVPAAALRELLRGLRSSGSMDRAIEAFELFHEGYRRGNRFWAVASMKEWKAFLLKDEEEIELIADEKELQARWEEVGGYLDIEKGTRIELATEWIRSPIRFKKPTPDRRQKLRREWIRCRMAGWESEAFAKAKEIAIEADRKLRQRQKRLNCAFIGAGSNAICGQPAQYLWHHDYGDARCEGHKADALSRGHQEGEEARLGCEFDGLMIDLSIWHDMARVRAHVIGSAVVHWVKSHQIEKEALPEHLAGAIHSMDDTDQASQPNEFTLRGDIFTIRYKDGDEFQMSSSKGLRQIAYLLARPGKEVPALTLAGIDEKREPGTCELEYIGEAKQEVLDNSAVRKLKERRDDYKDRIDRAEQAGETSLAAELKEEWDAVDEELVRQLRPSGQSRSFTAPQEQAGDSVRKNIRRAIKSLEPCDAELFQHLDRAIQLGQDCHYGPGKTMSWLTK